MSIAGTATTRYRSTEVQIDGVVQKAVRRGDTAALLMLLADERVQISDRLRRSVVLALATQTPGAPGPGHRPSVARTLGDPSVIPALCELVEGDPDRRVRRFAVAGLARMPDTAAIRGLLLGLDADDDVTRYWAVRGLGRLKAREAVPGLVRLLRDRSHRLAAAEALVTIRDERALEPLRDAAKHGSPWTRRRLRRDAQALASSLGYR